MTFSSEQPPAPEMSRSRRRRRRTDEEKRRIIAECDAPGSSVSIVARRHDLNANLLFTWRRQLQRGESKVGLDPASFVPAIIAPDDAAHPGSPAAAEQERQGSFKDSPGHRRSGVIEIVLSCGRRVIVEERVSVAALARVIGVLERP